MKFKSKYKSCFWTKTDIWGQLLRKKNVFLRIKWDRLIGVLSSRKRRRYQKLCKDYGLLTPASRPNQPYKFPRWAFKSALSNRACVRRFYGDLRYKTLKDICRKAKDVKSLIRTLEMRLDVNMYRLGFFTTIFGGKQAILHGKVLVNGKKITTDHFILKSGDMVEFCSSYRPILKSRIVAYRKNISYSERLKLKPTPSWIHTDYSNLSFVLFEDINLSIFYPFRVEFDEILNSFKYLY